MNITSFETEPAFAVSNYWTDQVHRNTYLDDERVSYYIIFLNGELYVTFLIDSHLT